MIPAPIKLTPEQVAEARDALMTLNRLLPQLQTLESCGINCQSRITVLKATVNQLEALLRHFGPGVE